MKKILSLLLLLLAFSSQSLFAQAAIKFEQTSHDFGSFLEKETQHYVFKFTNTGNEPLVIHQAITSCGCTVANFTKTPIEPGKTGEVNVTYNGKGKLFGPFKKTITIRSNAKPTIARLSIAGNMLEEAEEK